MTMNTLAIHGRLQNYSTQDIIDAIAASAVPASRRVWKRSSRRSTPKLRNSRMGRCKCGHCESCIDDARWERIFNEKFASPEYYGPRIQENWSTLARK